MSLIYGPGGGFEGRVVLVRSGVNVFIESVDRCRGGDVESGLVKPRM